MAAAAEGLSRGPLRLSRRGPQVWTRQDLGDFRPCFQGADKVVRAHHALHRVTARTPPPRESLGQGDGVLLETF